MLREIASDLWDASWIAFALVWIATAAYVFGG